MYQKIKFTSPLSLHLFYEFKTAYTIGSLRNYDPLEHYILFISKIFFDRRLIVPRECLISTDSAQIDPDCIPTAAAQPYPRLSKAFDQPLKDKVVKMYNTFASQHYS